LMCCVVLYLKLRIARDARVKAEEAVQTYNEIYGLKHPDTIDSLEWLANARRAIVDRKFCDSLAVKEVRVCNHCLRVGNWSRCSTCKAAYYCDMECAQADDHPQNCRVIPENACVMCWRGGCTQKCGGCKKVLYCSAECRNQDWVSHKTKCKEWRDEKLPEKKAEEGGEKA